MNIKKLLITLGALTIASTAVLAAEGDGFKAKSVEQELSYEDRDPGNPAYVKLNSAAYFSYEKWTFGLKGRSKWQMNQKDVPIIVNEKIVGTKRYERADGYVLLSGKRSFGDAFSYSLGGEWESSPASDIFRFTTSASYGIFSSWINPRYARADSETLVQNNQGFIVLAPRNTIGIEAEPIIITAWKSSMGDLSLSYYIDVAAANGTQRGTVDQEVNVYFPIYKNENWTINGTYTGYLGMDTIDHNGKQVYGVGSNADPFKVNALKASVAYKFSNGVAVSGYAKYETGTWEGRAKDANGNTTDEKTSEKSSYVETGIKWSYNF
ncbi:MAG: hypothetical protein ACRCSK_02750 [Fusobacteriaceae bacterium]